MVTRYIRRTPGLHQHIKTATGNTWDDVPTASVRSVGVVQGITCDASVLALPDREGDSRLEGTAAVKETIFDVVQRNSVSMPSALFGDAGTDVGRVVRAGSVKLRRVCSSGVLEKAGDDIMCLSCGHLRAVRIGNGVL